MNKVKNTDEHNFGSKHNKKNDPHFSHLLFELYLLIYLLQAKCYKKGVMDKMQKAKPIQAKANLLIQSC